MSARTVAACAALLAFCLKIAMAREDGVIYVQVDPNHNDHEEVEKRMTAELVRDLRTANSDVLRLYTEYTAKAGSDLKDFMKNISKYADDALRTVGSRPAEDAPAVCRGPFENKLKKIELDAYKAASFSGENHHKFLLGHMVVFRMHLNKTEEYIRKSETALNGCGVPCENQPKVRRWKRLALEEIHRIKDDLQHTRRSYKDLVAHAKRRLNHLRKEIGIRTTDAFEEYQKCLVINKRY